MLNFKHPMLTKQQWNINHSLVLYIYSRDEKSASSSKFVLYKLCSETLILLAYSFFLKKKYIYKTVNELGITSAGTSEPH